MRPIRQAFALLALVAAFPALAAQPTHGSADAALMRLADDYFDHWFFPTHPTQATQAGIHDYDGQLEDAGYGAILSSVRALRGYEKRFAAIDPRRLGGQAAGDRELLLGSIRGQLLELERIRPWENNPDTYSSSLAESAFTIMARRYAPPEVRLKRLIERERHMPAVLEAARVNLHDPPAIHTETALMQMPGMISFFRDDVPSAFAEVKDPALLREFAYANGAVIAALESYRDWMDKFLKPRSHGDFRIGARNYADKLRYDEMVDTPIAKLLAIGMADLHHNQRELKRVAHELDPGKSATEVVAALAKDHPPAAEVLKAYRDRIEGAADFLKTYAIITVPSDQRPIIEETPPFARATTFASMDTPGPFESVATEAYFNVTLPDPAWDAATADDFLGGNSYPRIIGTVVHEAYPGHYVQFLWMHQLHDRVRQLLGANSNAEGWAHYCEQMLLDEGFGQPGEGSADRREALQLRLAQLIDALLRDARYVVGVRMHTGTMSYAQGIDFFVREGFQPRKVAEMETRRGTADPTYLYYTLGKLQILKLREDLKHREGSRFSLKAFHDDFMRQGWPPLKIVRRALLGDDSPTL